MMPAAFSQLQLTWLSGNPPQPSCLESYSLPFETLQTAALKAIMLFRQPHFGVNLIGHAFVMFGIGEDIRKAARALQAADVPCCVIHQSEIRSDGSPGTVCGFLVNRMSNLGGA